MMEAKQPPLGVVIGIGNQKGGVGKSTNTVHLAAALGERGHKVLVLDLDPSAGSTKHLGIPPEGFLGTLELLTTRETPQTLAITEGMPQNVSLVPARTELSELDKLLSKFVDKTGILDRAIGLARVDYDFILLDTPPNPASPTTIAAYSAAEWFLLSVFPHPLSIGGLNEALRDIVDVRARKNPALEVMGVIITAVDGRTNLWRDVAQTVAAALPGRAFRTMISQAIEVAKCAGVGRTLFQVRYGSDHKVADQYRALAEEVVWRATNKGDFLKGGGPSKAAASTGLATESTTFESTGSAPLLAAANE